MAGSRPPPYEHLSAVSPSHQLPYIPYSDTPSTTPHIQTDGRLTSRSPPPPKYRDRSPSPRATTHHIPLSSYHTPSTYSFNLEEGRPDDADAPPPSYIASLAASYPPPLISRIPPAYYVDEEGGEQVALVYGDEIGSLSLTVEEWVARLIVVAVVVCVAVVVGAVAWNGMLW